MVQTRVASWLALCCGALLFVRGARRLAAAQVTTGTLVGCRP